MANKKLPPPWAPAEWEEDDAKALKSLQAGNASDVQQRRALAWIINKAAATYDEPFVAGDARTTDYLLGRRNVGLQIVKLLNVKLGALQKVKDGGREQPD